MFDPENIPTEPAGSPPTERTSPEPDRSAATKLYLLDPQFIRLEIVSGMIFSGVVAVTFLAGLLILWFNIGINWIWLTALGVSVLILLVLSYLTFLWPTKVYQHARWRLDDEALDIYRGVIWRHRVSIPLGRVQHADVSQGPLQRQFGLAKLTVHTAGTHDASVNLDGLSHQVALALRDRLVQQSQTRDAT